MQPQVIRVQEATRLDAANRVVKGLTISYVVGSYGPFTLATTAQEVQDGTAMRKMQDFANSLVALPTAQA
jgi:hypothetical protein